ncbi:MAG TPA: DUF6491 family protein [Rhizomicrobium sp.]|jgi:hypothetical protein
MKKHILLAVAGLAVTAASPALAAPRCLEYGQIYNFNALDDKTLIVEDDFHNKFKLSLMGVCPALPFKEGIGFKSFGPHMALSCVSAGDSIVTRNFGTGGQNCPIRSVEPYTAEMQKADAAAAAAKKAAEGH